MARRRAGRAAEAAAVAAAGRRIAGADMDGMPGRGYGPPPMSARPPRARPLPPHPGLRVISDEVVWAGRFPLQRVRFRYRRFDGSESGEVTWELWRRGFAVGVLLYDPAADGVAMIQQFRLPALAAGLDPVMTEVPAGLLEPGEDAEACARREVREETGLVPDRIERIGRYILTQGGCDETMTLFCARVSLPDAGAAANHGLGHEHEDTRLLVLPAAEALAMLEDNRIENATAALALGWFGRHRARLRRDWSQHAD